MAAVLNIITYVNWAMIDNEHKNGNKSIALEIPYCDFYFASDIESSDMGRTIFPFLTMFRVSDPKKAGQLEYDTRDRAWNYYYTGECVSGHAHDAIRKYLIQNKKFGEFALYINTASSDNLLFNDKVSMLDIK
jgi:hypothetical protein